MDHLAPSSGVNWYNCSPYGELLGGSQLPPMEFAGLEVGRQLTSQVHYASTPHVAVNSGIHYVQDTRNINFVEEVHIIQQDIHLPPAESKATNRIRPALGEKISCLECGATFACGANLRNHLRIHTGERPYVCEECGVSFTQRSNLRSHKRVHTGERPYMCGICGQTFARSSHLPGHMRTHTGEKPFNCPHCGRSFATNQIMKNHMRTHTGERPFVCDVCDATFAQSSCLATHKKIHTGERNFKCGECGKAFISRSGLQTHERVHTGEKPYTCEKCDKSFKTSSYLSKHKQKYCGNNGYKNRVERPDKKKTDRKTSVRKMGKSVKAVKSAARLPKRCLSKRLRRSRRHRGTESDEEVIVGLAMTNTREDLSSTETESMEVKREKIDARDSIIENVDINSATPQQCRYQENQDPLAVNFKDEKYHIGATSLGDLHQDIKPINSEQYHLSDNSTQIHHSEHSANVEEHVSDVLSEEIHDASQSTNEEQGRSTSQVLLETVPVQITERQNTQHSHISRNGEITWYSNDCLSYYCSRM